MLLNFLRYWRGRLLHCSIQDLDFAEKILPAKKNNQLGKKLRKLLPFVDQQGLLSVGGRLWKANIVEDYKHPIQNYSKNTKILFVETPQQSAIFCGHYRWSTGSLWRDTSMPYLRKVDEPTFITVDEWSVSSLYCTKLVFLALWRGLCRPHENQKAIKWRLRKL